MRTLIASVLLSTVLLVSTAHAAPDPEAQRSESGALALSVAGSALGITAMLSGLDQSRPETVIGLVAGTAGPALGHFYAGDFFTAGTLARAAGIGAMAYAIDEYDLGDDRGSELVLLGALTYIGGTIYDIASAPSAARAYNERHFQVAAAPIKDRAGSISPGFVLAGDF